MKLVDMVREAAAPLEDLGRTELVAGVLRQAGARGFKGESCECPVSDYLTTRVRALGALGPVRADVYPWSGGLNANVTVGEDTVAYRMYGAVVDFVKAFDAGVYPDLENKDREH